MRSSSRRTDQDETDEKRSRKRANIDVSSISSTTHKRQRGTRVRLSGRCPQKPLATRSSAMYEERPVVQQGTMILPYFDDEVPVVFLADGTRYIPVVALCRMLGLRPERHIPRWRRLFLWEHARKLPLQTEKN